MTVCVLDCSVALSWVLPGEGNGGTDGLLDAIAVGGAVVPALWRLEVGNVLLVAQRRGRITVADRVQALVTLAELPIEVDADGGDHAWGDTLHLASNYKLTLYDGCYLEAALRLGMGLATLDGDLRRAAGACGVVVLPAGLNP